MYDTIKRTHLSSLYFLTVIELDRMEETCLQNHVVNLNPYKFVFQHV